MATKGIQKAIEDLDREMNGGLQVLYWRMLERKQSLSDSPHRQVDHKMADLLSEIGITQFAINAVRPVNHWRLSCGIKKGVVRVPVDDQAAVMVVTSRPMTVTNQTISHDWLFPPDGMTIEERLTRLEQNAKIGATK